MSATYRVEMVLTVEVEIADAADTIERVTENRDEDGNPQPLGSGRGWQDYLYRMADAEEVVNHLAFNCVANGVTDAARLDGWADMAEGVTTMSIDRSSITYIDVEVTA